MVLAVVIGCLAGVYVGGALAKGTEYLYPATEREAWTILIWGDHWIPRLAVFAVVSTILGGGVMGLLVPLDRKRICGVALGLVSIAPYITLLAILRIYYWQATDSLNRIHWLILGGMVTTAVPAGMLGQGLGQWWRWRHPECYGRRGRVLGLHWSLWILGVGAALCGDDRHLVGDLQWLQVGLEHSMGCRQCDSSPVLVRFGLGSGGGYLPNLRCVGQGPFQETGRH